MDVRNREIAQHPSTWRKKGKISYNTFWWHVCQLISISLHFQLLSWRENKNNTDQEKEVRKEIFFFSPEFFLSKEICKKLVNTLLKRYLTTQLLRNDSFLKESLYKRETSNVFLHYLVVGIYSVGGICYFTSLEYQK